MTVNKEQFCDRCQVLTVPTARLCPHCENELKLASIESSPIEIVPGPILINRYQICKELINARITKYERSFLAQDLHSQELVSITNLYRNVDNIWIEDMGVTLEDLELFKQQALSWSDLQHPAIPKYLDAFYFNDSIDAGIFVVQAYIDAPSIGTLVREGRKFSEAEVIELAERILSILIYIHGRANPVFHGNISPETILLVERPGDSIGDIYLINFELSPTENIQSWRHNYKGPIYYMPLVGRVRYFFDSSHTYTDLESLQATLCHCLREEDLWILLHDNSQISRRLSNWLSGLAFFSSYRPFESAESARLALNTEDISLSSMSKIQSFDPDSTASITLLATDTPRSPNRSLYLKLILIGTICVLGWIVVAKNLMPTAERPQNTPPRSMSK